MKALFIILLCGQIMASIKCQSSLEREIDARDLDTHQEYLNRSGGKQGIKNFHQKSNSSNASIFMASKTSYNDRVVMLYHGFMASPFEMYELGHYLNHNYGYAIYIPIIPGFGTTHEVNGEFTFKEWQESVDENVSLLSKCFKKIDMIGYSIGGGILADYLLKEKNQVSSQIQINSLTLLAPFFKGATWQGSFLGPSVSKGFLSMFLNVFKLESVKLSFVDKVARGKYRDLEVLLRNPNHYTQVFSLKAAVNLMELSKSLKNVPKKKTIDLPTFLSYSESDQTIDYKFSEKYSKRHFSNLVDIRVIPQENRVPHEIVVPDESLNPNYLELYEDIGNFLSHY